MFDFGRGSALLRLCRLRRHPSLRSGVRLQSRLRLLQPGLRSEFVAARWVGTSTWKCARREGGFRRRIPLSAPHRECHAASGAHGPPLALVSGVVLVGAGHSHRRRCGASCALDRRAELPVATSKTTSKTRSAFGPYSFNCRMSPCGVGRGVEAIRPKGRPGLVRFLAACNPRSTEGERGVEVACLAQFSRRGDQSRPRQPVWPRRTI